MLETGFTTVTLQVAFLLEPSRAVQVIVAVPAETAVTRPERGFTSAMRLLLLDQRKSQLLLVLAVSLIEFSLPLWFCVFAEYRVTAVMLPFLSFLIRSVGPVKPE